MEEKVKIYLAGFVTIIVVAIILAFTLLSLSSKTSSLLGHTQPAIQNIKQQSPQTTSPTTTTNEIPFELRLLCGGSYLHLGVTYNFNTNTYNLNLTNSLVFIATPSIYPIKTGVFVRVDVLADGGRVSSDVYFIPSSNTITTNQIPAISKSQTHKIKIYLVDGSTDKDYCGRKVVEAIIANANINDYYIMGESRSG